MKTIGASVSLGRRERAVCCTFLRASVFWSAESMACPLSLPPQQPLGHLRVSGGGPVGPLLEEPVQFLVLLVLRPLHEAQHAPET